MSRPCGVVVSHHGSSSDLKADASVVEVGQQVEQFTH
jgi:hypothetical protein